MQHVLAQTQKQQTKIAFDLHAMQVHGNVQIGDRIGSEQDAMRAFDIQALNGKNVGRTAAILR